MAFGDFNGTIFAYRTSQIRMTANKSIVKMIIRNKTHQPCGPSRRQRKN